MLEQEKRLARSSMHACTIEREVQGRQEVARLEMSTGMLNRSCVTERFVSHRTHGTFLVRANARNLHANLPCQIACEENRAAPDMLV
jgi:hypothetical protein